MRAEHELKIWPQYFWAVVEGRKRFELRRNDRGFASNDILILKEWDPNSSEYTGRSVRCWVTYILDSGEMMAALEEGYCIMSIQPLVVKV